MINEKFKESFMSLLSLIGTALLVIIFVLSGFFTFVLGAILIIEGVLFPMALASGITCSIFTLSFLMIAYVSE